MKKIATLILILFSCIATKSFAQVVIDEFSYKATTSLDAGDWVELVSTSSTPINLHGWQLKDNNNNHVFTMPSYTLNPGGVVVLMSNTLKFTTLYPAVTNYIGPFTFGLDGNDQIRVFDSLGTLMSSVTYVDTLWPRGANGGGRSAELLNFSGDLNDPNNWFAGCMGGSPGSVYSPCNDSIYLTEVNYNSNPGFDAGDWVEVYNNTSSPIDISNWKFLDISDLDQFNIPNGISLPAHGYYIFAQDLNKFTCKFPAVTNVTGPFNYDLSSTGTRLRFKDNNFKMIYEIDYTSAAPWPTTPNGQGFTMELADPNGHKDDGSDWFAGCFGGSPGGAYNPSCPAITIYPNASITGATTVCKSSKLDYTAVSAAGVTYTWSVTGGSITTGAGTNHIKVKWTGTAGTLSLTVNAGACGTADSTINITISTPPTATITAGGPTTFCHGQSVVLTAASGTGYTYQWLKGANNISGATNISYTANKSGTYSCNINHAGCVKKSNGITVTVNCRSAEMPPMPLFDVNAAPNPFANNTSIKIESVSDAPIMVNTFDLTGKLIEQRELPAYSDELLLGDSWSAGMYFVEVIQGGNSKMVKVIKSE